MKQLPLPYLEDPMMQSAMMQEALAEAVLSALDGAFANGMPVALSSISLEGLDGNGTVTVNAVASDGTKFSADVEVMVPDASEEADESAGPAGEPEANAAGAPAEAGAMA